MRGLGWRRRTCGVFRGQVGDSAADADGLATLEREDEKTPALGRAGRGTDRSPVTPQRSFERENSLCDAGHRRVDVRTNRSELTSSAWIYAEPTRAGRRGAAKTRGSPENRSPATGVVAGDLKPQADFAVLNYHRAGRVTTCALRTEPVVSNRWKPAKPAGQRWQGPVGASTATLVAGGRRDATTD
jgi:hypothetical protein